MSRFAGLPAALRERSARVQDIEETEEEDCTDEAGDTAKSKKKDNEMTETEDAVAKAAAEATAAANARFSTVLASSDYPGNEQLAQAMLANSKLSAEEITGFLALVPKPSADAGLGEAEQREAAEEAGRKEMKEAINQNKNSSVEAGSGAGDASANNFGWGEIHAEIEAQRAG